MSNPTVIAIAERQYGLITWAQAQGAGVGKSDIRCYLRAGVWKHLSPRVYAIGPLFNVSDATQRLHTRVMAAQLTLGPRAFAGAETAAYLWGIQGLPRWDGSSVHMVFPGRGAQHRLRGVGLHTWDTLPEETTAIGEGIRLMTPGRTLRDTLLRVNRETGVCLMDSALNQGLVVQEDISDLEAANHGRRGSVRVRKWWPLADGRSASPLETRVRLICVDGGMPPTDLQRPFFDESGNLIGVVDFWWEGLQVIGEADGIGPHGQPEVLARDRIRQNALQACHPDVRIVRFTWQDLDRPEFILASITRAGAASSRRGSIDSGTGATFGRRE